MSLQIISRGLTRARPILCCAVSVEKESSSYPMKPLCWSCTPHVIRRRMYSTVKNATVAHSIDITAVWRWGNFAMIFSSVDRANAATFDTITRTTTCSKTRPALAQSLCRKVRTDASLSRRSLALGACEKMGETVS
jgi:hypothetical protein